jgi:hypothetical protein
MKRYLLIAMLLSILIVGCSFDLPSKPSEDEDGSAGVDPFELDWGDQSIFMSGLISSEQDILDSTLNFPIYHMEVEVSKDLASLHGRQEVRYTNLEEDTLTEIYFRLYPNVVGGSAEVSAVKVDDQVVEPGYEYADSALRVPLVEDLKPGKSVVVSMDFEIGIPTEQAGNYGLFGYFEDVLVLNEFYPVIPAYDDEGWNVEIPQPNGDFPNYDASYYVVRVIAPKKLTIVASGVKVGETEESGTQLLTYAAGPARNFYFAASDSFRVSSRVSGETTVNSYSFRSGEEIAEGVIKNAENALKSFNERYGTYPYTELDIVSTPMLALGMEYPGLIAITLELYNGDGEYGGMPNAIFIEGVIAHEVGHQWFFNIVGNDQTDEPWVDEAITQYVTGLYFFDLYGEDGYLGSRQSWLGRWSRVDGADIPIGLPAGEYAGPEYGAIVYGRGPLFIEALGEEMGQPTFDDFMRDYYQTFKWGRASSITFQQLAEKHCSCDLGDLFDEWVYGD